MTAPRLEIDLRAVTHNARTLVTLLEPRGITVTGVTKAVLGAPAVGAAMLRGGVGGLGDSRVQNLTRLRSAGLTAPLTLLRSPMVSQAALVVRHTDLSLNTEGVVLDSLSVAAASQSTRHSVVLMVELGDLREGVPVDDVVDLARSVRRMRNLRLVGIGTNLACRNGIVPDQRKMDELSRLAAQVEAACRMALPVVSGGNSANLDWALETADVGRVSSLRLGEAILLGVEPLHRRPIEGLRTDAFSLIGELIEVKTKPAQPWGDTAQAAFGRPSAAPKRGPIRQGIVALGRQDADNAGLTPPAGISVLAMSSDHLILDIGDHDLSAGDEVAFGLDYAALMRASTSPFVAKVEHDATRLMVEMPTGTT